MKKTFFGRYALLILCLIFFAVPFALRGARFSLATMKNNVKDWLPSNFQETSELTWFGKHFLGEQFILVTWDGCTADSESFRLFVNKLKSELFPTADQVAAWTEPPADPNPGELTNWKKQQEVQRARTLGDRLGLYTTGDFHANWGYQNEKWLKDDEDHWYYVTPDGELYRWEGGANLVGFLLRSFQRSTGSFKLTGERLATFGDPPRADDKNDFHDDPRKLTARLFSSITTGPEVLAELSAKGGPLWPLGGDYSDEERAEEAHKRALERLVGTLYGPDGKQTCVVVTLSAAGKANLRRVVGRGLLGKPRGKLVELAREAGVTPPPLPPLLPFVAEERPGGNVLRMGGPPVDNVAIDEEGEVTLFRLVGFSVFLGLVLSFVCFRSVKITIMVFFAGGISAVTSLAMVWWLGSSVDAILMSMPSLVYVLGLSGAVHIVNYYRDAVRESGVEGAPERALGHGWWPCALAAFTTSLGLLSLCKSNILPIQKFGFFAAVGVMATLFLLFAYLPSALQIWAPKVKRRAEGESGDPVEQESLLARFWEMVGCVVIKRHWLVTTGCLVVVVVVGLGLQKLGTDIQLLKLFDRHAKIIRDYTWLESNLGKLVPMELVVRFDKSYLQSTEAPVGDVSEDERIDQQLRYSILERIELAAAIQHALEAQFGEQGSGVVGRGISAASFAPPLPDASSHRTRLLYNTKLGDNRDRMLAEDYLAIDEQDQSELWRISLRLGALNDVDYGAFVSSLRNVVEPVLAAHRYRDDALRQLVEVKGEEGLREGRVYILGTGPPDAKTADEADADATASDEAQPAKEAVRKGDGAETVDQQALFAQTLNDLFRARGYRRNARSPKFLWWHDPEKESLQEMGARSDKWGEWLQTFDCMVLVADHPDYDIDFIKQAAAEKGAVFIDARDHVFNGAAEQQTAYHLNEPIGVVYTGVVPIVYKAQRTLLSSLIDSIFWAFVMIAIVMMFLLRSGKFGPLNVINFRGGMVSMLPNVFPVVVIFGAMGHMRLLVDIGSMMTASVAMGVAVDDTIHFLAWFRSGLKQGMSRNQSILLAYKRVGTAMTQTTLIAGVGLSVFAFSTFTPTQKFGILMLTLLGAALVGDLVFLPALLAGPLGRYFMPAKTGEEESLAYETLPEEEQAKAGGNVHTHPHTSSSSHVLRRDKAH